MFVLEMDASGSLWFYTDLHSSKNDHLRSVNLSFTDRAHGTYVSLAGRGEIVIDRAHIERLWTPFAKPWFPEGAESRSLALLQFVPDTADYWDGPNSRMARAFGMLASVVAGPPVAQGTHGTHSGLSMPPRGANVAP
jgi:general stress protein 26